jgi:hypothetical protein
MEGERKVSPNYCAVKWGVMDSKTNRQNNGQLSWVLNTQNLLLLYQGTTIWFWGGGGVFFLIGIFIFGSFRIKLFIFYIGKIKLFIYIFVVFSILDWSKSEGLNFFFLHLRDQNFFFQHTPGQNIYFKNLPSSPPPSKSNGRPLSQNFIWLYSLSVQRGRIEYEGETSV